MEGTFASLFASILATYCVYEDPLKANKDVSQEVVIAGCLDELARKGVFSLDQALLAHVYVPVCTHLFRSSSTGSTG